MVETRVTASEEVDGVPGEHDDVLGASGDSEGNVTEDRVTPNQSRSSSVLDRTKQIRGSKKCQQSRSVSTSWFTWLSLCESRNVLLCFYCFTARRKQLLTFSKKMDDAFSRTGFSNWKKAIERFKQHEKSQSHSEAVLIVQSVETVNVRAILDSSHKKLQLARQQTLIKHLLSLQYLVRQGLAVRGHEDKEGNFMQLLKLRSTDTKR